MPSPIPLSENNPPANSQHLQIDEKRIELFLQAVTDYAIYMIDPAGKIITWNAGAERNKGYTAEEVIGKHFSLFYLPEDIAAQKPEHEMRLARETGRYEEEGWRIRKDGTRFWANVILTPVYDQARVLQGFAKVTRDFTQRHAIDDQLRQSEERFRLLVQAVKDYAIYMLDPHGNVISWNEGAQRAKGYLSSEIIGQNFSRFYTPEEIASGRPTELLNLAATRGQIEVEGWRVRKDGSRFWADVTLTAIYNADGTVRGFAKVTRDVTDRRNTQEALRAKQDEINQLQKMEALGRLAGGIAHDFNNLLAGILGCAEAVRPSLPEGDIALEDVNEIEKACERGRLLVQQLMAFSRRQVAAPKTVQLNDVIKNMVQLMQRGVGPTVQIVYDLDPQIGLIQMDISQIEQILMNLTLNARDAMDGKGRIVIKTETAWVDDVGVIDGLPDRPCKTVLLTISDTGSGMTKEVLGKIFEPFYTTKPLGKGTGLGLSTVYGIIQQNKGGISVYSIPGMGTAFKIFLPIQGPTGEFNATPQPTIPQKVDDIRGHELILVVEDDAVVLRNTVRALQNLGYSVLSASDAEGASEIFQKARGKIHLLLTDIIMPGKNGKELADLLVQDDPKLKVLFMSGYPAETIASHGIIHAKVDLIEKPFNTKSLAKKVRDILDTK